MWYKAELEASQAAATAVQKQAAEQFEKITQLEDALQAQQDLVTEWRMTAAEVEAALANRQTEWNARHEKLVEDSMGLQTIIREQKMRLEASENELNRFLSQTNTQGQRLAEIHARLVERELQLKQAVNQLKQARAMIEKQNQAIKQIQLKASERIRALQAQLTNR